MTCLFPLSTVAADEMLKCSAPVFTGEAFCGQEALAGAAEELSIGVRNDDDGARTEDGN